MAVKVSQCNYLAHIFPTHCFCSDGRLGDLDHCGAEESCSDVADGILVLDVGFVVSVMDSF